MHLDVSRCQEVTGCFLPTSKCDGALLSTNTSTGLWFPSQKHFNTDTPASVLLQPAAKPTVISMADWCVPVHHSVPATGQLLHSQNFITCLTSCRCLGQQRVWKWNTAVGSLWQTWAVHSLLCVVLLLWKQQKGDVPWTKFSKQCNYKMAKG